MKDRHLEYEFFEFLPGALIEVDLASRQITYMNRIAFSLFGMNQDHIKSGLPLRNIFLNDEEYERSVKVAEKFGLESYQNRQAYTRYEKQDLYDFMLVRLDGTPFHSECQGSFVLDQDQIPVAARIYIRDLTHQRTMEASLQHNEEKYRTLVEHSTDLIWMVDNSGNILSVNKAVGDYLGLSVEAVEGKNVAELFSEEAVQVFKDFLNQVYINNQNMLFESVMPGTQGKFWISTSITPVHDAQGNITALQGVSRNITEMKQAREKVEKALIEARNANQVKDQFLANISHEIRTPLTSIMGFTERLKASVSDRLSPEERDYFKFINSNSERLIRTMDAILNISQLEAGTLTLVPETVHLAAMVKLICDALAITAKERNLTLDLTLDVSDDRTRVDESTIYQAILNIIDNAIKYTPEGGVNILLNRINGYLSLKISDSGIGISDQYRQRMFQLFSQESEGLAKDYQGIGLGLALTKRYVDLNQVSIEVESEKGKGSSFTLTFPLLADAGGTEINLE